MNWLHSEENVITVYTDKKFVRQCDEPCPVAVGTRVRILEDQRIPQFIRDDSTLVGSIGTVTGGDGGHLAIKLEDGREVALLLHGDSKKYEEVPDEAAV